MKLEICTSMESGLATELDDVLLSGVLYIILSIPFFIVVFSIFYSGIFHFYSGVSIFIVLFLFF